MSLENKHLRNGDHFAIIAFFSHSILLTNYAKNELLGAPNNGIKIMRGLMLGVHVVVEISRCRLADYVRSLY